MFVTLTEVVENTTRTTIDQEKKNSFTLREVTINPSYVVCVREDSRTRQLLAEGRLPDGLDRRQQFTRIYMDRGQSGIDIVVVGDPNTIEQSLGLGKGRGVLNG